MFNESNTTEEMILSALQSVGWKYIPPDEMPRADSDVMAEPMLRSALIRLNPVTLSPAFSLRISYHIMSDSGDSYLMKTLTPSAMTAK